MRYKPDPRIVIVIADITYSRMHSTLEPIPGRIYYKDVLDCWAKLPNLKFFRGYNWNLAGPRLASRAPKCDKVERLLPGGAVE